MIEKIISSFNDMLYIKENGVWYIFSEGRCDQAYVSPEDFPSPRDVVLFERK